jgi:hypothetical protein
MISLHFRFLTSKLPFWQIHLLQECFVARIVVETVKRPRGHQGAKKSVFLLIGAVEPLECIIRLAAECVDFRNAECVVWVIFYSQR